MSTCAPPRSQPWCGIWKTPSVWHASRRAAATVALLVVVLEEEEEESRKGDRSMQGGCHDDDMGEDEARDPLAPRRPCLPLACGWGRRYVSVQSLLILIHSSFGFASFHRSRMGPLISSSFSTCTTCPPCVISIRPSWASWIARRRTRGMQSRHAGHKARGTSEGQMVLGGNLRLVRARMVAVSWASVG